MMSRRKRARSSCDNASVDVCLISPLPPPYGGIARWTTLVLRAAADRSDVNISLVNAAIRGRREHDLSVARRIFAGVVQTAGVAVRLSLSLIVDRPEVVHLTTSASLGLFRDALVIALCRLSGVPVIYHLRFGRVPEMVEAESMEWKMLRVLVARVRWTLCIDEPTYLALCHTKANLHLLPNCVEVPPETVRTNPHMTVVYVGRLEEKKGVLELLAAWRAVGPQGLQLVLAGPIDPALRGRLADEVRGQSVVVTGAITHDQVLELVNDCLVFVLPSHTEGFPNVILEAMAVGKPIVGTDVGGIPEMLSGGCGVLVPPHDPGALATALRQLLTDPLLAGQLGRAARDKAVERFEVGVVLQKYAELWRSARRDNR